ncbi:MAG: MBL fold metallo-hydrolase [Bacteroidales bacterium]|nr:MBL fold metallo-hydrolase [Bacteroidales bacterium]
MKTKNNTIEKIYIGMLIFVLLIVMGIFLWKFFLTSEVIGAMSKNEDGTTEIIYNISQQNEQYIVYQLPMTDADGGCCYAISLPNGKLLMIDSGYRSDATYIRDFILKNGGEVEAWFVTHPHFDHAGGLVQVLQEEAQAVIDGKSKQIKVDTIYYAPFTESFFKDEKEGKNLEVLNSSILFYEFEQIKEYEEKQSEHAKFSPIGLGQKLDIEGIQITCMNSFNASVFDVNANSLVLHLNINDVTLMFTGDITDQSLAEMQEYWGNDEIWDVDYVQIPHHGYLAGISNDDLYTRTTPKAVFLDCSRNEYDTNAVNILEHLQWIEQSNIPVIKRFEGINRISIQ